jgi:hypothetical protein
MATKNKVEKEEPAEIVVPDYLKNAQTATVDTEALAGLGTKVPRISLKGRKFRVIVDGEEILKPADTLDVVILAVEPEKGRMVKTFYIKGYSSGDTEPPTCSSADGVRPDAWIQDAQNPTCQTCPKNQFGSATSQSGKPSKACRDSKRLSVAIPETEANADLNLGMNGTVFSLGVPVTSLSSLSEFGKTISKNGYPLPAVVVHLEMVDSEFPQVEFKFKGFLGESEGMIAIERNIARDWMSTPTGPLLENQGSSQKPSIASAKQMLGEEKAEAAGEAKSGDVNAVIGDWQ